MEHPESDWSRNRRLHRKVRSADRKSAEYGYPDSIAAAGKERNGSTAIMVWVWMTTLAVAPDPYR